MSVFLPKSELFNIFGDVAYYIYPYYIDAYIDDWRNEHKQKFADTLAFIKQPIFNLPIHNVYIPDVLNLRYFLNHFNIDLYYQQRKPKYWILFSSLLLKHPWASLDSITFFNGLIFIYYNYSIYNRHLACIKIEITFDDFETLFVSDIHPLVNISLCIPSLDSFFRDYRQNFLIKSK
jgi:hypothetical protein